MTLNLDLPGEIAIRLSQEAQRSGQSGEALTLQLRDRHLPYSQDYRHAAAVALLQQWIREDSQRNPDDDDDEFFRNLDAARTSNRPLFPPELKGVTW